MRHVLALTQEANREPVDIYFLGDSLTEFWTETGRDVWVRDWLALRPGNFGMAADRVEHILFRLEHGNLGTTQPKVFLLLAGTNNLAQDIPDSPEDTARGVAAIVDLLRAQRPAAEVLVVSILPNGELPGSPLRQRIRECNALLAKLATRERVSFVDAHDQFLLQNGEWKPGLTIDGTHLSTRGYAVLSYALQGPVRQALKSAGQGSASPSTAANGQAGSDRQSSAGNPPAE